MTGSSPGVDGVAGIVAGAGAEDRAPHSGGGESPRVSIDRRFSFERYLNLKIAIGQSSPSQNNVVYLAGFFACTASPSLHHSNG